MEPDENLEKMIYTWNLGSKAEREMCCYNATSHSICISIDNVEAQEDPSYTEQECM